MGDEGVLDSMCALSSGVGQDPRAIPDRAEEHRALEPRETEKWQRNTLQHADRIEVHRDGDTERQAIRRDRGRGLCRRLEDGRGARARYRIHVEPRPEARET